MIVRCDLVRLICGLIVLKLGCGGMVVCWIVSNVFISLVILVFVFKWLILVFVDLI